jgi:hypothetical protein
LRQRSDDIVVGSIGVAICLVRIVVVLGGKRDLEQILRTYCDQQGITFVNTFQSHDNVVCGTAAMSNGPWCDEVKLGWKLVGEDIGSSTLPA